VRVQPLELLKVAATALEQSCGAARSGTRVIANVIFG